MTRHILGLFLGQPGARAWRRHLSVYGPQSGAGTHTIVEALNKIKEGFLQGNRMAVE